MWTSLGSAFRITLVLTILTGLLYPAVVTGLAQVLFPAKAHGSLVYSGWQDRRIHAHRAELLEA